MTDNANQYGTIPDPGSFWATKERLSFLTVEPQPLITYRCARGHTFQAQRGSCTITFNRYAGGTQWSRTTDTICFDCLTEDANAKYRCEEVPTEGAAHGEGSERRSDGDRRDHDPADGPQSD